MKIRVVADYEVKEGSTDDLSADGCPVAAMIAVGQIISRDESEGIEVNLNGQNILCFTSLLSVSMSAGDSGK